MGQPSAKQSHEGGLFDEEFMDGQKPSDDNLNIFQEDNGIPVHKNNDITDHQLTEWIQDQRYKEMEQAKYPCKRKKYWGEPLNCASKKQIERDSYNYSKFKYFQSKMKPQKENKIFKLDNKF